MMNTVGKIIELDFRFEELNVELKKVINLMGFEGLNMDQLPAPFNEYLFRGITFAKELSDIRCVFKVIDDIELQGRKNSIVACGQELMVGRTIRNELEDSLKLAFFICTAGATYSERSKELLHGEDLALGYVFDLLGSAIVERVGDKVQDYIKNEMALQGYQITNRYSPGYCHWDVSEQQKLFEIMNENTCGVSLTASSLMLPIKSISGIIGIGEQVVYRDYLCALCQIKNCLYGGA